MHRLAKQHVVFVWIAMLGVLFSALAPALVHAVPVVQQPFGEEMQICTMAGMKTIVIGEADPGKSMPGSGDHPLKHCPCCPAHGGAPAMPPPVVFLFPASVSRAPYPPLFYQSATSLFPWTAAKPRAPPALR